MEGKRITVRHRVAGLALLAALAGCGGTADPYLTAPKNGGTDTTRPTIIGTIPAQNASSVSPGSMIIVTFSEAVDSASVTNAAFSLSGGAPGTISVSGASAQLVPYPALPANATVTVTIAGVKDLAGNTMAAPYSWSFTTGP